MIFKKNHFFSGTIFDQILIEGTPFIQCKYCSIIYEQEHHAVRRNQCSICTTIKQYENLTALAIKKIDNNFYVFSQHPTEGCKHIRKLLIDFSVKDNHLIPLAFIEVLEYGHRYDDVYINGRKLLRIINNTKKLRYAIGLLKPIIYVTQFEYYTPSDYEFIERTIKQLEDDFKVIKKITMYKGKKRALMLHKHFYKKSPYYPFLNILDELMELFSEYGSDTPISLLNDVLRKAGIKNQ